MPKYNFKKGDKVRLTYDYPNVGKKGELATVTKDLETSNDYCILQIKFNNPTIIANGGYVRRFEKVSPNESVGARFTVGDRVKIARDDPGKNYSKYGMLGRTGIVEKDNVFGDDSVSVKFDDKPDEWHSQTATFTNLDSLDKELPNGFFKGDRIYRTGNKSRQGNVVAAPSHHSWGNVPKVVWWKADDERKPTYFSADDALRVEGSENVVNKQPEVVHHCFKVNSDKVTFTKLGDYNQSPDDIINYLYNNHGTGSYLYKVKNQEVGQFVTLKTPSTPVCEVVKGLE